MQDIFIAIWIMFLLYVHLENSILNMYNLYIKMGQIILIYSFFLLVVVLLWSYDPMNF